jgi:hypothetical protein
MLKPTLSYGALEFILKKKLIPTCKIGALVLLVLNLLGLLLIGALILRHNISHSFYFLKINNESNSTS